MPRALTRELRIAAVADWLLGVPCKEIEARHGVVAGQAAGWARKTGHFRNRRFVNQPLTIENLSACNDGRGRYTADINNGEHL